MKTTRNPFCQCIHEIENNLPRTKFCFRPCNAQLQMRKKDQNTESISLHTTKGRLTTIPVDENVEAIVVEYKKPDSFKVFRFNVHPSQWDKVINENLLDSEVEFELKYSSSDYTEFAFLVFPKH